MSFPAQQQKHYYWVLKQKFNHANLDAIYLDFAKAFGSLIIGCYVTNGDTLVSLKA